MRTSLIQMFGKTVPAAGGFATPAHVQNTGIQTGSGVANDNALLGTVTAGNAIVVFIAGWHDSGYVTDTVTDNLGNTYNLVTSQGHYASGVDYSVEIWVALNVNGGSCTVTIDPVGASANYIAWGAAEFSGVALASAVDVFEENTGENTVTDANVTTASTSQASALLVTAAQVGHSTNDVQWGASPATGFTNLFQYPDPGNINSISADYKVLSETGVQSAQYSHVECTPSPNSWGAVAVVLKAAPE